MGERKSKARKSKADKISARKSRAKKNREKKTADIPLAKKRPAMPNYIKLLVGAVVVFLIAYFGMSALKIIKLNQELSKVTAENEELIKNRENLKLKLENINSANYIESQARRDLKLIKPNELLFIFPEKEYAQEDEESAGTNEEKSQQQDSESDTKDAGTNNKQDKQAE